MNLDHGVLNVALYKRGNIDAQIDKYKAQQTRIKADQRDVRHSNNVAAEKQAKAMFETLNKEHFQYYANLLGITRREAKAELKSDTHWNPSRAIQVMGVLLDRVDA